MKLLPGVRLRRRPLMTQIMRQLLPDGGIVVNWNEEAQSARLLGGELIYAEDIRRFYDLSGAGAAAGAEYGIGEGDPGGLEEAEIPERG